MDEVRRVAVAPTLFGMDDDDDEDAGPDEDVCDAGDMTAERWNIQ